MDPTQKGHCTVDSLGAHASRVSLMSLMGSQSTCHTQGLACSGLSSKVNHHPLILPLLPAPGTVSVACITPKGIQIADAHKPHDLGRLQGGHHPEKS